MDYSKEKELKKLKLNPFNTQCPHMKLHLTNAEVGSRNVECGRMESLRSVYLI